MEHREALINENQQENQSLVPASVIYDGEDFMPDDKQSVLSPEIDNKLEKYTLVSKKGAIFTMCISIVGAGCLSLSYALRNAGLIMGLILIFVGAFISYFTLDLLLIAAEYLPPNLKSLKPERNISYQTLAEYSYGMKLSKAVKCILTLQFFGASVAYIVTFCGTIDLVWSIYFDSTIYIECVLIICFLIIFPISLLRDLSSLQFTSLLGFSCSIYLCIVVVIEYFVLCDAAHEVTRLNISTTCVWRTQFHLTSKELFPQTVGDFVKGFLTAFPLIIFAFTGHPFVIPLYDKLADPSINKMRSIFKTALFVINAIYVLISTFGFLLFLDAVCGNLLLNDFKKHFDIVLAALGISLSCILTEPIFIWNFRRMIGLLCWNQKPKEISKVRHIAITFIFLSVNVLLAIFVKSISVVFGFLGSTTYPALGYLLPAIFFYKLAPEEYKMRKLVAVFLAIIICLISACSLVYKIYSPGDLECFNKQSIG
eukprot:219818_1